MSETNDTNPKPETQPNTIIGRFLEQFARPVKCSNCSLPRFLVRDNEGRWQILNPDLSPHRCWPTQAGKRSKRTLSENPDMPPARTLQPEEIALRRANRKAKLRNLERGWVPTHWNPPTKRS